MNKVITKIDEKTFKIEEDRHVESDVNVIEQLNNLAQVMQQTRQIIGGLDKIVQNLERYNTRVDIINEGIESAGLDFVKQEKCESVKEIKKLIKTIQGINMPKVEAKGKDAE